MRIQASGRTYAYAPSVSLAAAFTVAELGEMLKDVDKPLPWFANGRWWFQLGRGDEVGNSFSPY
jgi:hypothetical protein